MDALGRGLDHEVAHRMQPVRQLDVVRQATGSTGAHAAERRKHSHPCSASVRRVVVHDKLRLTLESRITVKRLLVALAPVVLDQFVPRRKEAERGDGEGIWGGSFFT